jgi:predicted O-methyltransferase YrrM
MANFDRLNQFIHEECLVDVDAFNKVGQKRFVRECTFSGWGAAGLMRVLNYALSECLDEDEEYLEIGTFGGRSLCGALQKNEARANVFDHYPFESGEEVYADWLKNTKACGLTDRINFFKKNCHTFEGNLPKIGVFFYDGNHDSGHTYHGLKRFARYLSDRAIVIVDDYDIPGGGQQVCFPGHAPHPLPVKNDTDRWIRETPQATLHAITPWTHKQAIISYDNSNFASR